MNPRVTPGTAETFAPLVPMKDFFRNPEITAFTISPDGAWIAYLRPWQSRLNVFVRKIGTQQEQRLTSSVKRDILNYFWKGSDRIVLLQDDGGDENFHLCSVGLDGQPEKDLTPFPGVRANMVDELEENDSELLIELNSRNPEVCDAYRINVITGAMELVAENPGNVIAWIPDNTGSIRAAWVYDGVNNAILYRPTDSDPFATVLTTNFREKIEPLQFTWDNRHLYVASNIGRDKVALVLLDPESGTELEVLYEHPEVDIEQLIVSRRRKLLLGVTFTTWRQGYHFFDDERRELQDWLEERLSGREVSIYSKTRNEDKYTVVTYSDRERSAYYLYDQATKELEKLADSCPWMDPAAMSEMRPISYTSRDGLTIHGYLTLPFGAEPRNLPVVVNPHGGPWHRDRWGFNAEVQFLANRGYAVLQINFRGSVGYGRKFWEASFKQWGRTMQDDISDGVAWLVDQEIADPKRVGIYGASYGGYATLAGLTFTPELYACGVDYVGVSNLFTFMKSVPPYWKPMMEMMHEMVGNPETDAELMTAASPVFHVGNIRAPLLIAQGANDPRVNKNESDQMVQALKSRGIDVPYIVKDNEGHGFYNEENRFEFYRAMEVFLARYLGGTAESSL